MVYPPTTPPAIASDRAPSFRLPETPLFGTDGIRGRIGDLLNAPLALEIGYWAGRILQTENGDRPGPVVIGQDSRTSSDMLAASIAAGLTSAGIDVWHLGLCPTPGVAYLSAHTEAIGGVAISASHNPPEDNGLKFFGRDGMKLLKTTTAQIEAGLRGATPHTLPLAWGRYSLMPTLLRDYASSLRQGLPDNIDLQGLTVVLDLAWGAAVDLAPALFQSLGARVIALHDRPDGDRINVGCGSTHLELLQAAVLEHRADLGMAFDGDADRALAVDDRGRVVDGDYILYLWGQALRAEGKLPDNLLVATVMANLGFEQAWLRSGGKFMRTAVGDQNVQAQMWETGAMLGGEQSGHVICRHYSHTGDGIQTALHLACSIRQAGASLAELVDRSFETYPQLLCNVRVEDPLRRRNWRECEPLQQAIAAAEADMGDRGRILVRPSGTEPLLRIMVEAESQELVQQWSDRLVAVASQHLAS